MHITCNFLTLETLVACNSEFIHLFVGYEPKSTLPQQLSLTLIELNQSIFRRRVIPIGALGQETLIDPLNEQGRRVKPVGALGQVKPIDLVKATK